MAKKTSGLGRGLGELFEDNKPFVSESQHAKVVLRKKDKSVAVSTAELYETKPKNKSLKANFR